jgi:sulfide:quinone oxidoreductase
MTENAATSPGVVIVGGGVAALECLMALRDLAGPDVRIRLVAPTDHFVYRPMQVAEPFSRGHARRYPLAEIAADFGAEHVSTAIAEVRPEARQVVCGNGAVLDYDALVLTPGARMVEAFAHATTFGQDTMHEALHGLLTDLEQGYTKKVAFVAPPGVTWTLPLYELALMTAREVRGMWVEDARFWLVTPEPRPLAVFGEPVSAEISELLTAAGIEFVGSSYADPRQGELRLEPGSRVLDVKRVVALPALKGPGITGVPSEGDGFIPTDPYGRVTGLDDVYAAGDATTFPVKQGGLAAQQADAVAEAVAARLGAEVTPHPFKPVLRGRLFTGGEDHFMRSAIGGGEGDPAIAPAPLWWPPTKVAGRYLAPYIFTRDEAQQLETAPPGFSDIVVPIPESSHE